MHKGKKLPLDFLHILIFFHNFIISFQIFHSIHDAQLLLVNNSDINFGCQVDILTNHIKIAPRINLLNVHNLTTKSLITASSFIKLKLIVKP